MLWTRADSSYPLENLFPLDYGWVRGEEKLIPLWYDGDTLPRTLSNMAEEAKNVAAEEDVGSGLITLIHSSAKFLNLPSAHLFPNDVTTEHLAITAIINESKLKIFNIYIPPPPPIHPASNPHLNSFFRPKVIPSLLEISMPITQPGTPPRPTPLLQTEEIPSMMLS